MQLRFRWANVNDVAIWDNRCVYRAATSDIDEAGLGERTAQRAVSVGEKPYLDQASSSLGEAIAQMTGDPALFKRFDSGLGFSELWFVHGTYC